MNVVGKVGSLISQGVYSVATPFHPFGGAVDVIVVQQQDGTFRSTPWYVRFGKFQGVLKGAEKMVRISVNGVEANFHMFLDNSGEAYFIREIGSIKPGSISEVGGAEDSRGDDDTCEDNSIISVDIHEESKLSNEYDSTGAERIERIDSRNDRTFYEFREEQSSSEGLEAMDIVETQSSESGVVLFSVDGRVLVAPISSTEDNTENLQLSTPQFHLGPGEETDFCEGNEELSDYLSDLEATTPKVSSENGGKLVIQAEETQNISYQGRYLRLDGTLEDECYKIERKAIFKSCLDVPELTAQVEETGDSEGKSPLSSIKVHETEGKSAHLRNGDGLSCSNTGSPNLKSEVEHDEKNILGTECTASDSMSVHSVSNDPEWRDEQFGMSPVAEGTQNNLQTPVPEDKYSTRDSVEPQTARSTGGAQIDFSPRFEISLCGNLLHTGMGLAAAAKTFDANRISKEDFTISAASIIKSENLVVRLGELYLPWDKAASIVLGRAVFGIDLPIEPKDAIPVESDGTPRSIDSDSGVTPTSSRRWRLWPIPFRRVKTLKHTGSNSSSEEVFLDSESGSQIPNAEPTPASRGGNGSPRKQFIRTNIPTTEQIASLNLQDGQNVITFSFSTRVLGTQQVDAHIYLWKWNARIVISDVDGTITKSDVLGQFMPLVGKDWTQSGVARLFCAIKENGYQLLFLSARAIVQAYLTRSFLLNLKQDGKTLPSGPIVISPDGLFPSLFREVIRRAPHEFKIACLEDIKALFPSDYNPFYAGFGNRDTDELSYRKIGIPKGKIFIINPKGEVAINHCIDVKSYTSLHTLVNDMFPPTSLVEQEDFNSWNYWRMPITDINL